MRACNVSYVQDTSWKETFPPFLRDAMRAIGMDPDAWGAQTELATQAGIKASTLSRWLAGGMQPGIPALREIARVLRVRPVDALVAAGHLEPADVGTHPRTAEESIDQMPGLTERERGELRGYLAAIRNRTGYFDIPEPSDEADAAAEEGGELRDNAG